MAVLIDATVLIAWERRGGGVDRRVRGREGEAFFLSVITASELLHGVHRASDRVRRAKRSAFVEAVLDAFPLLPIDLPTARMHAEVWAELAAGGRMIGAHDLWLGAAALAHGLTVVTANTREFARIPALAVEEWGSG